MTVEHDEDDAVNGLISAGSDIAGGVAGAAAGLLIAGPAGVLVGGASGPLMTRTFRRLAVEVRHRLLGQREETRIGATMAFAAARIRERLDDAEQVRNDGFFEGDAGNRSTAEEVMEGVLLAAQREHEEKKVKYEGRLLASFAFNNWIDKGQANLLIRLARELSYQQICLLAIFGQRERYGLRADNYRDNPTLPKNTVAVLQELLDLDSKGMVNAGSVLFGLTDIAPAQLKIEGTGATLFQLMELTDVDQEDLTRVAAKLQ